MLGVIILGHGSRAKGAEDALRDLVDTIKADLGEVLVEPAYLNFNHPDLPESMARLAGQGADRVVVVPFFLFNGNHLQRDIPRALELEREKYRGRVEITAAKSLFGDRRIAGILLDRIREVAL